MNLERAREYLDNALHGPECPMSQRTPLGDCTCGLTDAADAVEAQAAQGEAGVVPSLNDMRRAIHERWATEVEMGDINAHWQANTAESAAKAVRDLLLTSPTPPAPDAGLERAAQPHTGLTGDPQTVARVLRPHIQRLAYQAILAPHDGRRFADVLTDHLVGHLPMLPGIDIRVRAAGVEADDPWNANEARALRWRPESDT